MLSWHDIKITALPTPGCCGRIPEDAKEKEIIRGVSGSALPGEFISIIGASGAGKTTLLNHLSGRLAAKNLTVEGTVKLNGKSTDTIENYSQYSAYI